MGAWGGGRAPRHGTCLILFWCGAQGVHKASAQDKWGIWRVCVSVVAGQCGGVDGGLSGSGTGGKPTHLEKNAHSPTPHNSHKPLGDFDIRTYLDKSI